jgi:hypothetical protein
MEHETNAAYDGRNQAGSAWVGAGVSKTVSPPRTFDGIASAASDLRDLNGRIDAILGRLGHERAEQTCDNAATLQIVGPDYSRSLRRLAEQISELRSNIAALESHV